MKNFLLTIAALCAFFFSNAQFSVKWGEQAKLKYGNAPEYLGTDSKGNHYLEFDILKIGFSGVQTYLVVVDKNMNVVKDVKFEIPKKADRSLDGFQMLGDDLYAITTSSTDKHYSIYWQKVPLATLVGTGSATKIAEIPFEKKRDKGTISYGLSADQTKFFVALSHSREKGEKARLSAVMLDKDMNELWLSDIIDLPYMDEKFAIQQMNADNSGNLYLQGKVFSGEKMSMKKGNLEYEYHIFQITENGSKVSDDEIKLEDMYVNSLRFDQQDGKIRLFGMYSLKATNKAAGLMILTLDQNSGNLAEMHKEPYDQDLFSEFRTEKEQAKADKKKAKGKEDELYEYSIRNIVYHADGTYDVVSEQYYWYTTTVTTTTANGTQTRTIYHYIHNDIVISKFDSSDNNLWTTAIHKNQHSTNDGGIALGYALFVDGDDLYFMYNDNVKNTGKFDPSTWKTYVPNPKTGVVVYTKVDKNGEKVKKEMFTSKEMGMIAIPKVWERMDDSSMFTFVTKGKKKQFGKLVKK